MRPEELAAMDTRAMFDWLRLNTDEPCAAVIDALEERWLLTSSAAKLWFEHAAGGIAEERERLDERARHAEMNL